MNDNGTDSTLVRAASAPSVGTPIDRVDGRLKVTGGAKYSAEMPVANVAHAVLLTSTIGRGRILSIDAAAALALPGVLAVLTPFNAPKLPGAPHSGPQTPPPQPAQQQGAGAQGGQGGQGASPGGQGASSQGGQSQGGGGQSSSGAQGPAARGGAMRVPTLLQDPYVRYNGQPIGVVIADTFEQARAAVDVVVVRYESERPVLDAAHAPRNSAETVHPLRGERIARRGNIDAGIAAGTVHVEQTYTTPIENHNPMEPHNTLAVWEGDQLTLYESTQGITSVRNSVASTFGIPSEKVRVISHFTGGGFGSKGGPWSHEAIAAMAAREVKRPVKLVLTRRQMFGPVGGRPLTMQQVTLAAGNDGTLTAVRHHSTSNTSTLEDWVEPATDATRLLYACPNVETQYDLVRLNVGSPTFMRAPGESSGLFALESAMDELAYALKMDPVALRLQNYAETDPESSKPWSSKSLRDCYRLAGERFGWSRRSPAPRSMRDGKWLVGWGMATATYPARRSPAGCVARMLPDGRAWLRAGTQEIGCGTYTSMTQVAADALGLPAEQIRFELGETDMPENPASTGSVTMASTGTAVHEAATLLRSRLVQLAIADSASPLAGATEGDVHVADGRLSLASNASRGETFAALLARNGGRTIEATSNSRPGAEAQEYSMHSFGAVFTEVRIDPDLGVIRVPRIVTAHGTGRIINPKTARSQIVGGVIWGVGMALLEEALIDPRTGRYVNADLAEYHVPVNADIGIIDTIFADEHDLHVSAIGAKGAGEIGITGVAASIANAVYHATGVRVRSLPITLDKLL